MTILRPYRDKPPLDSGALERLALAYAGRYATSRAGLARYLNRKIAERGVDEKAPPDIEALVDRFAALGYVDDRALAEARGRSFARRGLGARRLDETLRTLGIAESDAEQARETAQASAWEIALRFAERRRIGPFAPSVADEAGRRHAFAAMMRAGHAPEHVRKIISAQPGDVPSWDE